MANRKPTVGTRAVSIDISPEHQTIIRESIEVWRDGVREDLENADRRPMSDPDGARRLAAAYERVLEALDAGRLWLPDQEAREALEEAKDAHLANAPKVIALNNAHRALLAVFDQGDDGPAERGSRGAPEDDWTTRDDDLAMESAVLQRVLHIHPARVTAAELRREVLGEEADFGDCDAVERAAHDLGAVGLVHNRDEFVTPTRAALRFQELIEGGVA
jgi:hypothetical protein